MFRVEIIGIDQKLFRFFGVFGLGRFCMFVICDHLHYTYLFGEFRC